MSDVVREAQEIVELALKGLLRQVGIEPPRWHDVGELLRDIARAFSKPAAAAVSHRAVSRRAVRAGLDLPSAQD